MVVVVVCINVEIIYSNNNIRIHCTPPPLGGHTLLDVDSTPTLRDLHELVIRRVAHKVDSFPLHLGLESYVIGIATKDHPGDSVRALLKILTKWLHCEDGTGKADRTWRSVLRALDSDRNRELAGQLRTQRFGL